MKHTKGPWKLNKVDHLLLIEDHYSIVATIEPQLHDNEMDNAKLIAAAPEMLEVLELYEGIDDLESQARFTEAVIKVIKKARGE